MKRTVWGTILMTCAGSLAFGQSSEPAFEAADVHVSAKTPNQFVRTGPARGGRYEVKNATIVDLIRIAHGFDTDKILGGPNWLELDRFDVIAKVPPGSDPDSQKLMLQSLLKDRFKLVTHADTRPLPTYALTVGKKHQLKEAAGSEETGCKPQTASGAPGEGGGRLMMSTSSGGPPITVNLGPGMTVQYLCRNISMTAFAAGLRGMIGTSLGSNSVLDETGLKGNWNFDIRYSMQMMGPMMPGMADRITIFSAVDKQLGLKLDERQIPTPVIVVDSVNRKPGENPSGTSEALPAIPVPTEFEVAVIKVADPNVRMSRYQMQPGGRLVVEGMPLQFLISRAFNSNNNDQIVGLPAFATTDRYEINAKTSVGGPAGSMDMDLIAPMMLALLKDRFKMTYHTEERPVTAYTLVSAKPKMKKADPSSRISCKNGNAPPGAPPGSRLYTCQNVTMAQFAERLQNLAPGLNWPIQDATELEGGWDFSLMFSMRPMMAMQMGMGGRGGGDVGPAAPAVPMASEPAEGYTIFEAIEKQLGLKLEKQKRTMPVIVIDHIEQKPTEN